MKKFVIFILSFCLLLFMTSCVQKSHKEIPIESSIYKQQFVDQTVDITDNLKPTTANDDIGGGSLDLTKYRSIYCDIPRPFINLVDLYEFQDWYEVIIENDPNKTEIMPMKLFVIEFDISREAFDKANLEWAKIIIEGFKGQPVMNPRDFANQEINEVYNADIIYTFDDEVINKYYLSYEYPYLYELEFEQAVANGTYQTQTEDWIDIEQMEADIIAKYGEAEIVTEVTETTTIPEETDSTDLSQIETNE